MKGIDYKTMFGFSGIYQIKNILNGKTYIGSSKNIYNRLHYHICKMKYNSGHNKHLQYSYHKYGEDNFEASVLLYCNPKDVFTFEQLFLSKYQPEYNKSFNVQGNLNIKINPKLKKQISDTLKEKYKSGEITAYKQQHSWKTIHVYDITTLSLVGSYKNMKEVSKILSYTGKPSYTQFLSTLKKDKNTNKYKYLCSLEILSKEELIDKIKEKLPNRKYKELSNLPF